MTREERERQPRAKASARALGARRSEGDVDAAFASSQLSNLAAWIGKDRDIRRDRRHRGSMGVWEGEAEAEGDGDWEGEGVRRAGRGEAQ